MANSFNVSPLQSGMTCILRYLGQIPSSTNAFLNGWAVKLAKYIPMDEYKKSRMKHTLHAYGISQIMEEFMAFALVKSLLVALGVIQFIAAIAFSRI
jgi:hypothetical protein